MGDVLNDSYSLAAMATLERIQPGLEARFEAAFVAAEPDLREWMPSAAKEQEAAAAFVERCWRDFDAAEAFPYGIVAPGGDVIGYINLTPAADHAVLAYWVHPRWRRRGVASLAVRILVDASFAAMPGLERVHAHLDAANEASRRVLERAGFVHHESFIRPPRTRSESDTEWLFVRERYPRGIETERLWLRDLRPDDEESMVCLWTDAEVARYMDDFGPRTPTEVAQWIPEALEAARCEPWFRTWVMERRATGDVVGWLGFGGDSSGVGDIDFAYIVASEHRSNGYGGEAVRGAVRYCFTTLGARSFWGQCHTGNEASARAMQSAGLAYIGTVDGQHRFRATAALPEDHR